MSAFAVLTVEESFVLVKRPVTAEGVMSSVTPLPFDVFMLVSSSTHSVPSAVGLQSGLRLPLLVLSVQTVGFTAASKLPLLCARAIEAESVASANNTVETFILVILFLLRSLVLYSASSLYRH